MLTVIALGKKALPERRLSLLCMNAMLAFARDGTFRRNTLVNLESAFAQPISFVAFVRKTEVVPLTNQLRWGQSNEPIVTRSRCG